MRLENGVCRFGLAIHDLTNPASPQHTAAHAGHSARRHGFHRRPRRSSSSSTIRARSRIWKGVLFCDVSCSGRFENAVFQQCLLQFQRRTTTRHTLLCSMLEVFADSSSDEARGFGCTYSGVSPVRAAREIKWGKGLPEGFADLSARSSRRSGQWGPVGYVSACFVAG